MAERLVEEARIVSNGCHQGDYYQLLLAAPGIADRVRPGQFVHLRLPAVERFVLRRPFSVCDADPRRGHLTVLYKPVGAGTRYLTELAASTTLELLGPLGNGFPLPARDQWPVIVAGGYGSAATYLLAKLAPTPGVCLLGGRRAADILLAERFAAAGFAVQVATDDGSRGHRGLVTELLAPALAAAAAAGRSAGVYACGPNAMLAAVAAGCAPGRVTAYVSVDEHLCCGVGACFTCVVRRRSPAAPAGWEYVRSCCEGPVFRADDLLWPAAAGQP
jgi:dihydroorotate dehydrogenase electron transfer subunit